MPVDEALRVLLAGWPTGTYFVRTGIDGYSDELYADFPGRGPIPAGFPVSALPAKHAQSAPHL